mmetsp:Transcript_34162/g.71076  ORF Transcript_34162/g.71076 Transcript_34162/m.71076 type:complete len:96 (-) Transcript_34162:152-439(-)
MVVSICLPQIWSLLQLKTPFSTNESRNVLKRSGFRRILAGPFAQLENFKFALLTQTEVLTVATEWQMRIIAFSCFCTLKSHFGIAGGLIVSIFFN